MGAVRGHKRGGLDSIQQPIRHTTGKSFTSNGINAPVRAASARHFHQGVVNVYLVEVERFGTALPRGHIKTFLNVVDRDYPAGVHQSCTLHRELSYGAAAP